MSTQTVSQLASHWMGEIMQGKPQITLEELRQAQMPDNLRDDLIMHGKAVLEDEINRIYDSPFLDRSSKLTGGKDPRNVLRQLLQEMMILPEHAVERIVTRVFRDILDTWRCSPLSIRMANDDPAGFAAEIFERAHSMSPVDDNGISFSVDVLSHVCEASGLELISKVVTCEEQLGLDELDAVELARVLQRFLLLKEKYQIKRNMISYEGERTTLGQKVQTAPKPHIPAPKPEMKYSEPVKGVENSAIADLIDQEPDEDVKTPEENFTLNDLEEDDDSFKTILDELPDIETGSETVDDLDKFEQDEPTGTSSFDHDDFSYLENPEPVVDETPIMIGKRRRSRVKEVKKPDSAKVIGDDIPSQVIQENVELYQTLMTEDNIEEFSAVFFKDNVEEYKNLVINACTHTSWKHARVAADNELFLNNVPVAAIPTQKFFKILQNHFLGS